MVRKARLVLVAALAVTACETDPTGPGRENDVHTVEVTPVQLSLVVGDERTFTATARAADGTALAGGQVTWTSTDVSVAEVTSTGHVTARAAGTTQISASVSGKLGKALIAVAVPAVERVELDVVTLTLEEGGEHQLVATPIDQRGLPISGLGIQWSSSSPEVAAVNALGGVTAVRAGSATITARVHGKEASGTVTVEANYTYDLLYTVSTSGYGLAEVFRVDMQAGAAGTPQFPAGTWAHTPQPSPDGTLIAHGCWGWFGEHAVCISDVDGGNRRMVSWSMSEQHAAPSWSPDGNRLAFVRTRTEPGSNLARSRIAVVDVDGSNLVILTADMDGDQMTPAWSRGPVDGSERIAFSSGDGASRQIWTMRSDGTDRWQITAGGDALDSQPDWSPDGGTIVFQRFGIHHVRNLWLVDSDGTGVRALGPSLLGTQASPAWSPDGRLIAFISTHESSGTGSASYQLYTIWADGTKLARRSFDAGDKGNPAWLAGS